MKLCTYCSKIYPPPKSNDVIARHYRTHDFIERRTCVPCLRVIAAQKEKKPPPTDEEMVDWLMEMTDLPDYVDKYVKAFHATIHHGDELTPAQADLLNRTYWRAKKR